jgi:hypothetical protein
MTCRICDERLVGDDPEVCSICAERMLSDDEVRMLTESYLISLDGSLTQEQRSLVVRIAQLVARDAVRWAIS